MTIKNTIPPMMMAMEPTLELDFSAVNRGKP